MTYHPPAITLTLMPNVKPTARFLSSRIPSGLAFLLTALLAFNHASAFAADTVASAGSAPTAATTQPADPDPSKSPALAALQKSGAKLYYLGQYAGLDGWLAVKDGKMQTIYKNDKDTFALAGLLFAPNGDNLTTDQIKKLSATNKEVADAVAGKVDSSSTTANKDASLSAGEQLLKALRNNPNVTLGAKDDAPTLYVLISPGIPACKTFWQNIRASVKSGTVRVKLYPAGLKDSEDERVSANLLQAKDPYAAWDKYVEGDTKTLSVKAEQPAIDKVATNTALIDKWKFPTAPYIVYRGKDGKVKVVQGAPADVKPILDDASPETTESAKP